MAGALGWLVVEQPKLGIALACAACVVPLLLASGVSIRGCVLGIALVGHLASGPLYVQGLVSNSFSVFLDVLVLVAFGLLAYQSQSPARPWRVAALALIALVVLQALNPLLPSLGYGLTGARPIVVPLLLLVAVGSGQLNRRDETVLVVIGVLGWIINVVLASRQLIFGFTGAELHWIESTRATYLVGEQVRLLGATRSDQDFAFLVAVAFPAVCACALAHGRSLRWRAGFSLLALATLGVLFGSLVRSALVGGLIGALGVAVVMARNRGARQRMAAFAVTLIVIVWLVASFGLGLVLSNNQAQTVKTRVESVFEPSQDYSFQQRETTVWPHVVHEIGVYPLGAGAGSAGPLSQTQEDAPLGSLVPDNGYLLIAIQFGIPGLLLFLLTLVLLAAELWRRARHGKLAAAAGLGAVVALCVAMLTGNFISLVSPSCVWAILVGLGLRAEPATAPAPAKAPKPVAAAIA